MAKILLIGYGNPGRLDDGLGPKLAQRIEELNLLDVTIEADYQLQVEDAAKIAENDIVIFADAAVSGKAPFFLKPIKAKIDELNFSSHSLSPETVLGLAKKLFSARTKAYVLGIRGYKFNGFEEKISPKALKNLDQAVDFLNNALCTQFFLRRKKNGRN
jgi:hydrogenase maturation protease